MTPSRIIAAALAFAAAVTLTAPPHAAPYRAPHTADGQPDLQGFWTTLSATSLQRVPGAPLTFATRAQERAYEVNLMAQVARVETAGLGQRSEERRVGKECRS